MNLKKTFGHSVIILMISFFSTHSFDSYLTLIGRLFSNNLSGNGLNYFGSFSCTKVRVIDRVTRQIIVLAHLFKWPESVCYKLQLAIGLTIKFVFSL